MPTLNLAVSVGSNDAQEIAGTVVINGTTTGSNDLDEVTDFVGIRYPASGVPQGATITTSYLTVRTNANGADEPLVTIFCQDADSTSTFTTGASNISARPRTTASASWNQTDLGVAAGTDIQSPSLNAPLQELVDRPSFGGDIVIIIQGGNDLTRDLGFQLFEHADAGAGAPRLHIEYTTGGGAGDTFIMGLHDIDDGFGPVSAAQLNGVIQ